MNPPYISKKKKKSENKPVNTNIDEMIKIFNIGMAPNLKTKYQ
jgi:hypothetical protein